LLTALDPSGAFAAAASSGVASCCSTVTSLLVLYTTPGADACDPELVLPHPAKSDNAITAITAGIKIFFIAFIFFVSFLI
jgi:hypothetical protein